VRALRRLFRLVALVCLGAAALLVYRRRFATRRERVDLYHEDGTLVSFEQGTDGADRLLPLAHDVLRAARG
jgi:hypothetical protein